MLLLLAELQTKPAFTAQVEAILRQLAEVAAQESGNVCYAVHSPQEQPGSFVLYELYRDRHACESHLQSARVQKALQDFESMLLAPPKIRFCDTVASTLQA
ncbi:MAG: antibiotic biosynthesis monooxygenase [Burkholderiales bacterium]|nr:antibiotic biosynthesis monooxygenase [Burkholderiales bacterium]